MIVESRTGRDEALAGLALSVPVIAAAGRLLFWAEALIRDPPFGGAGAGPFDLAAFALCLLAGLALLGAGLTSGASCLSALKDPKRDHDARAGLVSALVATAWASPVGCLWLVS